MTKTSINKHYDDHCVFVEYTVDLFKKNYEIMIGFNFTNEVDFFKISNEIEEMLTYCDDYEDSCHFSGCNWDDDFWEENEFKEWCNKIFKSDKDINFVVVFSPYYVNDMEDEKIEKFRIKIVDYLRSKDKSIKED